MKKVLTFIFSIALLGTLTAQTVDEILDNYFETIGGREAWSELKTMKTNASMTMQGMTFEGIIYAKHPNKQRVNVNVNGTELIQAYDGETAWWINPFMGGAEAQEMPADMAESMTRQEFDSPFLNYKEKGYTVELLGEKEVEGAATYEIRLTKKNEDVELYYFDKQDYIPIKMSMTVSSGQMKGQTVDTFFSNYDEVNELVMPLAIEVKMGGQTLQKITFQEVVFNEEMEDDYFAYPKK